MDIKGFKMPTLILLSNCDINDPGGRAEKFLARKEFLEKNGWDIIISNISPPGDFRSYTSMNDIFRCIQIARQNDVDVIHSVSEPMQLHLTGYLLSRIINVPWLMEMRDPLATNPEIEQGSLKKPLREYLEKYFVHRADTVMWIDGIQLPDTYFQDRYPNSPKDKFIKTQRMGFDTEIFEETFENEFNKFTITYAGSFYDGWIEPYPIFSALELFVDQHPDIELTIQFYGDWKPEYTTAAKKRGVEKYLSIHDWINYEDLVPILKGSDALLYIGGNDKRNRLNIPTKIYDYVGAQTPILAVVDHSFRVAKFIKDNKVGLVADPEKPTEIAETIYELYTGTNRCTPSDISQFGRQDSLRELKIILDELIE